MWESLPRSCSLYTTPHHAAPSLALSLASRRLDASTSLPELPKRFVHELVCQLHAQEGSRVGGHGPRQRGPEAREEGLESPLAVQLADDPADGHVPLCRLQARLDRVDGEDGYPHGHARGGARARHGRQAQLARGPPRGRVLGAEAALDELVGGEVGGGPGTVAGEGGGAAAEDAAEPALAVELADDVEPARVLGLLAGRELLLVLDLKDDLDALEGGGDGRHGDGGEEAGGGDLADGETVGADGCEAGDDLLA